MHTFLWVDVADAGAQREEEAFFNGAIKSMIIKMAHLSCENLLGNSFDQLDRLTSTLALHDDTTGFAQCSKFHENDFTKFFVK